MVLCLHEIQAHVSIVAIDLPGSICFWLKRTEGNTCSDGDGASDGDGEEEIVSATLPGLMNHGKWNERQVQGSCHHKGLSEYGSCGNV